MRNGRIELNAVSGMQDFLPLANQKFDPARQDEKDLLTLMMAHDPASLGGLRGPDNERAHDPIWRQAGHQRKVRARITGLSVLFSHDRVGTD